MTAVKVPILLVDDRPANLLALEAVLDSPDYELVRAQSGREALEALEHREFALVLVDLVMPVQDGLETLRLFHERRPRDRTPFIVVTGFDTARARILEAYAAGAVDFVQKPIEPIVVRTKVAVFADLHRTRTEAATEKDAGEALRRDAAATVHEFEQRFRQLVDAVSEYAIFMLDASGQVSTWNSGAEKIKGYDRSEIVGKHFSIFYTPEDRAAGRPEQVLDMVRRTGRFEEENWRLRKDGTRFWATVSISALRDPRGAVTGFAKVTKDLTSKRRAEENEQALARERIARASSESERRRLLRLLEHVPAVVNVLRGSELVFEFAHPKAVEALGGRELAGRPLLEAIPEYAGHPEIAARLRRVLETGEPSHLREHAMGLVSSAAAKATYWDSVYLPILDDDGAVEGVLTFDVDVTASVVARREMERVNRAKDEFLATMSHELRTPLNAIYGWASILRKRPREEHELERGLEVIERNALMQTRLVSDLLDVSRIMTGKLDLKVRKAPVFPVLMAAVDVLRAAAEAKGIRLVVDIDPEIGELLMDPDRLQQIVWNLLSNAVRFTPRGGRVTMTGDRAESLVVVRVVDTGMGIASEHLPHIFERFMQVDSTTTRAHGGLGLGLSIVRYLAEAHGGTVDVRSAGVGHGATFTLTLPIAAVATARDAPGATDEPPPSLGPAEADPASHRTLQGLKILAVDDDPDSLEVLQTVLTAAGAEVTTSTGARDAFELLDSHGPFDIIVSDIGMPEVDGYAFIRTVRARATGADVPAIALTAYARAEDAQLAKSAGYQQHLTKPVDERLLVTTVNRWSRPELCSS